MGKMNCLAVSVFLVSIFVLSGMVFGQRVIDLDKVWGDMRVLGKNAYDDIGDAVAYGDINGDGYMDIIIGAPCADPGGRTNAGKTYVIFGSSSPPLIIDLSSQSADITVYGDDESDRSGWSVASGDINGDSYDDIIIGAPYANPGDPPRSYAGDTYVIFGSSFPSPPYTIDLSIQSADITVYGDDAGDHSGRAVACGDMNGDGYDDIIIGAYGADPGGRSYAGKTYVIFGSSFPSPPYILDLNSWPADIIVCGAAANDESGHAVASGDVNGDGYDDIIIGAHNANPYGGRIDAGETYVIFGSSSPPKTIDLSFQSADITVYGDDEWDLSGWSVASGDINGDGFDDIIIGAPWADPGDPIRDDAGEAYVIFGSSLPSSSIDLSSQSADITVCGDDVWDDSGTAVASGDVNGDGYYDIIIGADSADPGGRIGAGETYVIFGSASPPSTLDLSTQSADITVYGDDYHDYSGYAVASGDVNNDSYDDIIIGAYGADPGTRDSAGKTYVIFGSSNPPSTFDLNTQSADITVYGSDAHDHSSRGVASGDINGDGYDDIIIGALHADPGGRSNAGETYIIFGSSFPSPPYILDLNSWPADITVYGDDAEDYSGYAVASGDVNGDGYGDVIIGAEGADPGARDWAGETYVIFGSSSPPSIIDLSIDSADITVYGDDADDRCGFAVANGDVNGDGYRDVIIGAYGADPLGGTNAGETYVIFGSSNPPSTFDLNTQSAEITIYGDDGYDQSGFAVASGDVNNDGYHDVIIGAHNADPGGKTAAGETYVIFGSSFLSPPYTIDLNTDSADITVYGDDEDDLSGYAIASGDENGDGYDDIIIGALGGDPAGGTTAGETYVIFGSSSPPSIIDLSIDSADITVYGDDEDDASGFAVASGDVNGDGYDDVIIGAPRADPGVRSQAGETYLILGGGAIITAHGLGGTSQIKELSLLGRKWSQFRAFGPPNAQGEVHLAIGDIDGDGLDEIVAGQGEGGDSWVKLFEMDGTLIGKFRAFGPANANGEVHLAIGNFDTDPSDKEIAIAQGEGGQSLVKLFEADGTFKRKFTAFGPPNAQGEVHVAAGDLNNSGIDKIIVGMGEGGSSWVKIFNYMGTFIRRFRVFGATGNPGGEVHVAVGNFDADADLEIAVATGYNGGNLVKLYEKTGTLIKRFQAFGAPNANGEVHLATADMDNDGIDEIIVGMGEGGSSWVKVFKKNGILLRKFRAFGAANTQGEVHLAKSNY